MTIRALLCLFLLMVSIGCGKPDPEARLHRAAKMGRVEQMQEFVKAGEDLNKVVDGLTPLQAATKSHQLKSMRWLLEQGADSTVKDPQGRDLWELATPNRNFINRAEADAMAVLVEHGFEGRITLLEAVKKADSAQLVTALLKHGESHAQVDENGWTPLHHAAEQGHEESCLALLQGQADVNAETTREYGEKRQHGDSWTWKFHYQAGSRPLDVASYEGGGRTGPSAHALIEEWGGTSNQAIKNIRR